MAAHQARLTPPPPRPFPCPPWQAVSPGPGEKAGRGWRGAGGGEEDGRPPGAPDALPPALSPALHGRRCPLDPARRQGRGGGVLAPVAFSYGDPFCMGLLYGRAGRLTPQNGGFRPGQCSARPARPAGSPSSAPRPAWSARCAQGSVALSLCTAAHPLYSGFANRFGAPMSEAIMRPNPRWATSASLRCTARSARSAPSRRPARLRRGR